MPQSPIPLRIEHNSDWIKDGYDIGAPARTAYALLPETWTALFWARNRSSKIELPWKKGGYYILRASLEPLGARDWGYEIGGESRLLNQHIGDLVERFGWGGAAPNPISMAVFVRRKSVILLEDRCPKHPAGCGHVFFGDEIGGHDRFEEIERIVHDYDDLFMLPRAPGHG